MRKAALVIALTFYVLIFPRTAETASATRTEAAYNALHATERKTFRLTEKNQARLIIQSYEEQFRPRLEKAALLQATANDLNWLMKAAYLVANYSFEPRHLADLHLISSELERRGNATNDQRSTLYRALIGYRRFDEARLYLLEHPDLKVKPVPAVDVGEGPDEGEVPIYRIDPHRFKLVQQNLQISGGTLVVVVSHPLCAFSRSAMKAVADDPDILMALDEKLIWLAPADMRLHFDEVQKWNQDHPLTPVILAKQRANWPMIDRWATPQFYLLRNGKVLDHFSGWPINEGNKERLLELLARGNFMTSARPGPGSLAE